MSKYNVGDRVRLLANSPQYQLHKEWQGKEAMIDAVYDENGLIIYKLIFGYKPDYEVAQERDIELVAPYDPKTAFLTELKGLLKKYGYAISSGIDFSRESIDEAYQGMSFVSSDPATDIQYAPKYGCIGTCNIMDYDKD